MELSDYWTIVCSFVIFFNKAHGGMYLIKDYYLDPSHSSLFGGICEKAIFDDCAYVNSHINNLYIAKYGGNKDCYATLSTETAEAKYKLTTKHFKLQPPDENGDCTNDYVEFYDGPQVNESTLFGRFCGTDEPDFTSFPSGKYITVKFVSDDSAGYTGFRFLATKHFELPCLEDQFHCTHENSCIAGALKCDGTKQCHDGVDENDCSTWDKIMGKFLALGIGGLMGVGIGILVGCVGIWVIVCICNFCSCCPLFKRRKRKQNNVNINDDQDEEASKSDGKSMASSLDLNSPPPKYGHQWGMPNVG